MRGERGVCKPLNQKVGGCFLCSLFFLVFSCTEQFLSLFFAVGWIMGGEAQGRANKNGPPGGGLCGPTRGP